MAHGRAITAFAARQSRADIRVGCATTRADLSLHSVSIPPSVPLKKHSGLFRAGDASVCMLFSVSLSQSAAAGRGIASLECVYGNYVPVDVQG